MRLLAITELMRMTRTELCDLLLHITTALPGFPANSPEYANAHASLQNVSRRPVVEALFRPLSYPFLGASVLESSCAGDHV
jgi:hypothetical protein